MLLKKIIEFASTHQERVSHNSNKDVEESKKQAVIASSVMDSQLIRPKNTTRIEEAVSYYQPSTMAENHIIPRKVTPMSHSFILPETQQLLTPGLALPSQFTKGRLGKTSRAPSVPVSSTHEEEKDNDQVFAFDEDM